MAALLQASNATVTRERDEMHYLDHAATTPMRAEALEVFQAAAAQFGNPSSLHRIGQAAKARLEGARALIADTLGAESVELILTSGGTESLNMAIKGQFWARGPERNVIIVPEGEHHAVLDTVEWLERHDGAQLIWVPLQRDGRINQAAWQEALAEYGDRVALAVCIWVNNETGTVQPLPALADTAAGHDVPLHVDAVAAYGHEVIDFSQLLQLNPHVSVSVSAHKIGGPQGIGALLLGRGTTLESLIHGGGQQRKLRAGTENVLATEAFAAAAQAMSERFAGERADRIRLRDRIRESVFGIPDARVNGSPEYASDAIVHATFAGCESDSLLFLLDTAGVEVSTGSACQAGVTEISHVVLALGYSEDEARGSLRFSLGHSSTDADVDALIAALPDAVDRARAAGRAARSTRFDER
ncbi:MAG: cysteine desulfurase family protein [Agromyces sp.]